MDGAMRDLERQATALRGVSDPAEAARIVDYLRNIVPEILALLDRKIDRKRQDLSSFENWADGEEARSARCKAEAAACKAEAERWKTDAATAKAAAEKFERAQDKQFLEMVIRARQHEPRVSLTSLAAAIDSALKMQADLGAALGAPEIARIAAAVYLALYDKHYLELPEAAGGVTIKIALPELPARMDPGWIGKTLPTQSSQNVSAEQRARILRLAYSADSEI